MSFEPMPVSQEILTDFSDALQWSSDFVISCVIRGELTLNYKNHVRDFRLHDFYFFKPFESYSFLHAEPDTAVLSIMIDAKYLDEFCPGCTSAVFLQNHVRYDQTGYAWQRLCRDFAIILFADHENDLSAHLKILQAANDIIITLLDQFCSTGADLRNPDYNSVRISRIIEYIENHYSEPFGVPDISAFLGLHPQYFSTYFKKNFGISFVSYLAKVRVNHSIKSLLYSHDSILSIALNNGFSNHKTYSTAFEKLYGMAPGEYRKLSVRHAREELIPNAAGSPPASAGMKEDLLFFRPFYTAKEDTQLPQKSSKKTLHFDTSALLADVELNPLQLYVSVGRAAAVLRSDIQKQLIQAKAEIGFRYARVRDIFSDDLYVYYDREDAEPVYNWSSLDSVFDFLISNGIHPFPELGYMPSDLARHKQYAGWQYHPNISAPKNLKNWQALIRHFLEHILTRYGISEVHTWLFDFWTAPDLKLSSPYWHESQEDFFEFYRATYDVFRQVDPELQLGSPNFSTIEGFPWYHAFFRYCNAQGLRPSFISIHLYGLRPRKSETLPDSLYNNSGDDFFDSSDADIIPGYLDQLQAIAQENGFAGVRVIASDWNLSFLPNDLIRDTCYMGPYIAHIFNTCRSRASALCYWSLSDIHEDFFPEYRLFPGGPGLFDLRGLRKASYNTMVLLNMLGREVLSAGDGYIFARSGNEYTLLLYNLGRIEPTRLRMDRSSMDDAHRYNVYISTAAQTCNIDISLPEGPYYIKKYEVNRNYGSAYDTWVDMGHPSLLIKDMEDYLAENSTCHVSYSYRNITRALILDESVPCHGVVLFRIIPR